MAGPTAARPGQQSLPVIHRAMQDACRHLEQLKQVGGVWVPPASAQHTAVKTCRAIIVVTLLVAFDHDCCKR
jgi:hypothetical protein